eukprot:29822-Pelagococcus_subviridis.AAC.2
MPAKVLKDRRSPRRRCRMGTSVERTSRAEHLLHVAVAASRRGREVRRARPRRRRRLEREDVAARVEAAGAVAGAVPPRPRRAHRLAPRRRLRVRDAKRRHPRGGVRHARRGRVSRVQHERVAAAVGDAGRLEVRDLFPRRRGEIRDGRAGPRRRLRAGVGSGALVVIRPRVEVPGRRPIGRIGRPPALPPRSGVEPHRAGAAVQARVPRREDVVVEVVHVGGEARSKRLRSRARRGDVRDGLVPPRVHRRVRGRGLEV